MYMGANVPWGGAILNPRGIIGRIYVKHHITLLHTKYTSSSGSCGFREDFSYASYYKPKADNDVHEAYGMVVRLYKEDFLTLLHTKYKSSRPHGF